MIYILLFLADIIWGLNVIIVKYNYASFDPVFLVYLKVLFSMFSLLILIYIKKIPFEKVYVKDLIINANLLHVFNFILTYLAFQSMKGFQIATINCLSPLIMLLITFKKQKMNLKKFFCSFLILLGFCFTIHFRFKVLNFGFLMMTTSLFLYNYGLYRLKGIHHHTFIYNFYMLCVAFVELTVLLIVKGSPFFYHISTFYFWLFVLFSGVGYAFIQCVSFLSIQKCGPFLTSFFLAFNPLFTYLFSIFLLKESFDGMALIGFLCVFVASLKLLNTSKIMHEGH